MQSAAQRLQEQYEAALAKAPEDRNWLDRMKITAHDNKGAATQTQTVKVVEYTSQSDMGKGITKMLADGWEIAGQSAATPNKKTLSTLATGTTFFRPKIVTTVTYIRPTTTRQ
jgi:hypothetical protein